MTFLITEYPSPTWSFSKMKLLEECELKYYYQTYQSHNGWLLSARPEVRKAYLLKSLRSIDGVFGETFHTSVKNIINGTIKNRTPASLRIFVSNIIKNQYCQSLHYKGKWMQSPKKYSMISEVYYAKDICQSKKEQINRKAKTCTDGLFNNTNFKEILDGKFEIIELDELKSFQFDGITAFLKIDALLRDSKGKFVIIDWKTSEGTSNNDLMQLWLYAYYVSSTYNVCHEEIEGNVEYVALNESHKVSFLDIQMKMAENKLKEDIQRIRSFIIPGTENQPMNIDAFTATNNKRSCQRCNYRELCEGSRLRQLKG